MLFFHSHTKKILAKLLMDKFPNLISIGRLRLICTNFCVCTVQEIKSWNFITTTYMLRKQTKNTVVWYDLLLCFINAINFLTENICQHHQFNGTNLLIHRLLLILINKYFIFQCIRDIDNWNKLKRKIHER